MAVDKELVDLADQSSKSHCLMSEGQSVEVTAPTLVVVGRTPSRRLLLLLRLALRARLSDGREGGRIAVAARGLVVELFSLGGARVVC